MQVWSAPVRYVECDQQGVVFNAHYLTWADEALPALLARLGTPYAELVARDLDLTVVASELSWSSSARYGDRVEVDGELDRSAAAASCSDSGCGSASGCAAACARRTS